MLLTLPKHTQFKDELEKKFLTEDKSDVNETFVYAS